MSNFFDNLSIVIFTFLILALFFIISFILTSILYRYKRFFSRLYNSIIKRLNDEETLIITINDVDNKNNK